MKRRYLLFLFLLGVGVTYAAAGYQNTPGYMDADYYFAGGMRLSAGEGFTEVTLWNYLDDPNELPHPSHAYWMPLASIVAWVGIKAGVFLTPFEAAQSVFVLIAGMVPPVTAALAYSLTGKQGLAGLAGVLAVFSGFYLPYLATTDTFGLYMLLGGTFFLLMGENRDMRTWHYIVLGAIAGLMHLARADGVIWLVIAWCGVIGFNLDFSGEKKSTAAASRPRILANRGVLVNFLFIFTGYLIVMGPWFARNMIEFGIPLTTGGARTLWLTKYNELFSYPADLLTPAHWWRSGLGTILLERLYALGQHLQTFIAVQGSIFLSPLIVIGVWKFRNDTRVQLAVMAWLLTLASMSLLFPFTGVNGGFFHSGAAMQPMLWALAPVGLSKSIHWIGQRRKWNIPEATNVFRSGIVVLAIGLSSLLFFQKMVGDDLSTPKWDSYYLEYAALNSELIQLGAIPEDVVLVINPPGFNLASSRPAIVIPNGDVDTLLAVARAFGTNYVLLENDHPLGLEALYKEPGDRAGLEYLGEFQHTQIYKIDMDEK